MTPDYFGQGYNCPRHGAQYKLPCEHCVREDSKLVERGYREGLEKGRVLGWNDAVEIAAQRCAELCLEWNIQSGHAEELRKLKKS